MFNDYQFCPYVTSNLSDETTMILWSNFLLKVIDDFENQGYILNHIAEVKNLAIANKTYMLYDYYIRHNMHAVEWKLNAMINRTKV